MSDKTAYSTLVDAGWVDTNTRSNALVRTSLWSSLEQYFANICRLFIFKRLTLLKIGSLTIKETGKRTCTFTGEKNGISGEIEVLDESFWPRLLFQGPMGFAEAFMDGIINCSDVTEVLELLILNRDDMSDFSTIPSLIMSLALGLYRAANSISVSISNVAKHYDLSNQMFAAFLSPDMTYSCPIWNLDSDGTKDSETLEEAQQRKLCKIISEARIKSTDHVLEIGTGWGSFAIEAVRQTGCSITSVTLSIEQKEEAENRIAAANLSNNIQVLLQDYRQIPLLEGGYDKIVSIEMLEHVGRENHEEYFATVSKLLNQRHGIAVFQTSTMPEMRYESYCRGTDFIRKHIFPGANVPSVTQVISSMNRGSNGNLIPDKIENIGGHYVKTLRLWRQNFLRNFESEIRPELVKTNSSMNKCQVEVFRRKWEWYFAYCEAGFSTKTLGAVIFTATREGNMEMIKEIPRA